MGTIYERGIILLLCVLAGFSSNAQDLEDLLDQATGKEQTDYTFATFKSTRVINLQSVEQLGHGVLDVRISHRFSRLDEGFAGFYGLDAANIRLAMEYGITDRLMVGLGRSKEPGKSVDAFLKGKLLRQSTGAKNMPVTVSYFGSFVARTQAWGIQGRDYTFAHRLTWTNQLMIARKFNEKLSLQLSPGIVHRNLVSSADLSNDIVYLGMSGRYMLGGSVSLNMEYIYQLPNQQDPGTHNSFSVGFDIETGGHVFQLQFTNSFGMIEKAFVTETTSDWMDAGIHFGFNISRVFTVVR